MCHITWAICCYSDSDLENAILRRVDLCKSFSWSKVTNTEGDKAKYRYEALIPAQDLSDLTYLANPLQDNAKCYTKISPRSYPKSPLATLFPESFWCPKPEGCRYTIKSQLVSPRLLKSLIWWWLHSDNILVLEVLFELKAHHPICLEQKSLRFKSCLNSLELMSALGPTSDSISKTSLSAEK